MRRLATEIVQSFKEKDKQKVEIGEKVNNHSMTGFDINKLISDDVQKKDIKFDNPKDETKNNSSQKSEKEQNEQS